MRLNLNTFLLSKCGYFKYSMKFFLLLFFSVILSSSAFAQNDQFCVFDEYLSQTIANNPGYAQIYESNNLIIEQATDGAQQQPAPGTVFTIPVVFHVLHLGVGTNSDISETLIQEAVDQLNADFRNSTDGADVEIEFCLAKRDPFGNSTNGIVKYDASNEPYYAALGMAQDLNEIDLKSDTRWPNTDYINIWVVHDIANNSNGANLAGYATFPGTAADLDGIVLRYDVVGNTGNGKVISHEMGHFFQLYHTFETEGLGGCSPNAPCDADPSNNDTEICCRNTGDRCCDTPSHQETFGCPTSIANPCEPNEIDALANHMSYTDNSCRILFTDDQATRMRSALTELRTPLTISLGCEEPCPISSADPDFTLEAAGGNFFLATAAEDNEDQYFWTVAGQQQGGNGQVEFLNGGVYIYDVCLYVTKNGCSNKSCQTVTNLNDSECDIEDPCELVRNPDFKINNIAPAASYHFESVPDLSLLCGWAPQGTAFICDNGFNDQYVGMVGSERYSTYYELGLIDGVTYNIEFEYFVLSDLQNQTSDLFVGFTELYGFQSTLVNVVSLFNLPGNVVAADEYPVPCLQQEEDFESFNGTFTYNSSIHGKYLYISTGAIPSSPNTVLLKNISISQCAGPCTPETELIIENDGCSYTFTAMDQGEAENYEWNIITNQETYLGGNQFEYMFMEDGEYEICVTASCSENQSITICETFNVSCGSCTETFNLPINDFICDPADGRVIEDFSLTVGKGYRPCDAMNNVPMSSYEVDDSDLTVDVIHFALTEDDLALGEILICAPNGDVYCYTLQPGGSTSCETCTEVSTPQLATCVDTNPFDETSSYSGTFTLSNVPLGATSCGSTADMPGYSDDGGNSDGNGNWAFSYEINTTTTGTFNTSVLVCFEVGGTQQLCYTIDIAPGDPCPAPVDCVFEAPDIRTYECSGVATNYDDFGVPTYTGVFNVSGRIAALSVFDEGYVVCDTDFGTLDDGYIVDNFSTTSTPGSTVLDWNFDIEISCNALVNGVVDYDLTMFLCNPDGKQVCITINLELGCENCENAKRSSLAYEEEVAEQLRVYPNPVTNTLYIEYADKELLTSKSLYLMSIDGTTVLKSSFKGNDTSIDVSEIKPGLYILALRNEKGLVEKQKVVILK